MDKPKIICLCGSTRFVGTFNEWRKRLTLEGNIILSIELVLPQSEREDPQHHNYKVKQMLDELHLRKIDLADEIFILNVGGYIGESTSREVTYAQKLGKPIKYLEPVRSVLPKTYDESVKRYGKRPADIVYAITKKDTAQEIFDEFTGHLGIPKTDKPFITTVQIDSEWLKSWKAKFGVK